MIFDSDGGRQKKWKAFTKKNIKDTINKRKCLCNLFIRQIVFMSKERDKQMNTRHTMILIKGEIKTSEIMSCQYNGNTKKWDVKFNNGKTYSYGYFNVEKLKDPAVLKPNRYRISREGREFFDITAIYEFRSEYDYYWHICFGDGSERDYRRSDLNIVESCLNQSQSESVFEYIK